MSLYFWQYWVLNSAHLLDRYFNTWSMPLTLKIYYLILFPVRTFGIKKDTLFVNILVYKVFKIHWHKPFHSLFKFYFIIFTFTYMCMHYLGHLPCQTHRPFLCRTYSHSCFPTLQSFSLFIKHSVLYTIVRFSECSSIIVSMGLISIF
jgi:hypothetical protein